MVDLHVATTIGEDTQINHISLPHNKCVQGRHDTASADAARSVLGRKSQDRYHGAHRE